MDTSTGKPIASLKLTSGGSPLRFDITPDGRSALVTIENRPNNPTVAMVDLVGFKMTSTITIPDKANIYGVAVTPDGKFAYVVTQSLATAQNTVYVIDLGTNQVSPPATARGRRETAAPNEIRSVLAQLDAGRRFSRSTSSSGMRAIKTALLQKLSSGPVSVCHPIQN
jgi:DNA-binding beta-propeller fold protein YncE